MGYSEEHRSAGAVAAKTARACDSCLRRRARWFCEADDAFLCQTCDTSVHSANPLARRHHRVRLKTSSTPYPSSSDENMTPPWLNGLIRKPRTPRGKPGQSTSAAAKIEPLVPDLEDLSLAEENHLAEEEQLLYCVPILDPALLMELGSNPRLEEADNEVKPIAVEIPEYDHVPCVDGLDGYGPTSDLDLAEFASHMETLLGRGLDDDAFCIDGLGLVEEAASDQGCGEVKVEMDLDLDLDGPYDLDVHCGAAAVTAVETEQDTKRGTILNLDYGAVIIAWSSNGNCSPWMDGERPQFDASDTWPDLFQGAIGGGGGGAGGLYKQPGHMATAGEGREARVSRYREKRRTRLFSKKIRYEVRKLNAEKRPRMKGRFVKRAAPPSPIPVAMQKSALSYR